MELLDINALTAGRVLARPVVNEAGAVLCPAGLELNASIIERLRAVGITSVLVVGGEDRMRSVDDRIEELKRRFEGVDDAIMLQLKALMENRLDLLRQT